MAESLVIKTADGTSVAHVNSLTDTDITKISTMLSDVTELNQSILTLDKIIISTNSPSGGTAGQLWFKYEA